MDRKNDGMSSNGKQQIDNSEKIEKALNSIKEKINPSEEQMEKLKFFAEKYSGKSEEDMFFEIIKVNKSMHENMSEEEYQKKMEKLEKIRPMLNEEQGKKLDKLIKAMKEDR
ncbi:hypothetical protein [Dethiothermospora halolimnae]|uniref:hypothetical protein n=1 Tax=Dethiothermospora halolimnae TaxID=3114390 RepID=UPI003CCB86EE